jgi:hypothetical protein
MSAAPDVYAASAALLLALLPFSSAILTSALEIGSTGASATSAPFNSSSEHRVMQLVAASAPVPTAAATAAVAATAGRLSRGAACTKLALRWGGSHEAAGPFVARDAAAMGDLPLRSLAEWMLRDRAAGVDNVLLLLMPLLLLPLLLQIVDVGAVVVAGYGVGGVGGGARGVCVYGGWGGDAVFEGGSSCPGWLGVLCPPATGAAPAHMRAYGYIHLLPTNPLM